MKILKATDFVAIPTAPLWDDNLSLEAKGVFCILCDMPEGMELTDYDLAQTCRVTIGELRDAIRELKVAGYIGEHDGSLALFEKSVFSK